MTIGEALELVGRVMDQRKTLTGLARPCDAEVAAALAEVALAAYERGRADERAAFDDHARRQPRCSSATSAAPATGPTTRPT